jgi:RNA polymerase sigma-70 factor (ECF subfamily)
MCASLARSMAVFRTRSKVSRTKAQDVRGQYAGGAIVTRVEQSDGELLQRWAEGDERAGDSLVSRHFASVHGFLRGRIGDDDLPDLVHQTFLACLQKPERFQGRASFRTYLLAIARNQLVSHLRRLELEQRSLPELDPLDQSSPSGRLAKKAEQQLLLRALRRLPMDLQLTLELFYWEDMATADIAIVMDAQPATVRTRLSRARALLADQIRILGEDPTITQSVITNLEDWARSLRGAAKDDPKSGE